MCPIDYIWGVVDIVPSSDLPDIRNKTAIHSPNGSCMIIPREGDKIRLYIQLSDQDVEKDIQTGRIDKSKVGPQQLMEVAKKAFHPYHIDYVGEIDWWTIYISKQSCLPSRRCRVDENFSRAARRFAVLGKGAGVHCRRCLPHTFS